jgi:hypothetical protein
MKATEPDSPSPSSPGKFDSDYESESEVSISMDESSDSSDEDLKKSLTANEFHMYNEHCTKKCANICSKKRKNYV